MLTFWNTRLFGGQKLILNARIKDFCNAKSSMYVYF